MRMGFAPWGEPPLLHKTTLTTVANRGLTLTAQLTRRPVGRAARA